MTEPYTSIKFTKIKIQFCNTFNRLTLIYNNLIVEGNFKKALNHLNSLGRNLENVFFAYMSKVFFTIIFNINLSELRL